MTPAHPGTDYLVVEGGFKWLAIFAGPGNHRSGDDFPLQQPRHETSSMPGVPLHSYWAPHSNPPTAHQPAMCRPAAVAQLQFLQLHQMTRIVMKRPHDVLSTNALSLAIQLSAIRIPGRNTSKLHDHCRA